MDKLKSCATFKLVKVDPLLHEMFTTFISTSMMNNSMAVGSKKKKSLVLE